MRPIDIEIMIHYYTRVVDIDMTPPAYRDSVSSLLARDMLEVHTSDEVKYDISEKGRAYVEALKAIPLPEQVWITPGENCGT